MHTDLYIKKLKKLRNYKELAKASLWSGLICFFVMFIWFIIMEEKFMYAPHAVDEVLSFTVGLSFILSVVLLVLALTFHIMYRQTMRSYGSDMNLWMDELGDEGMTEVFAGRGKSPLFYFISFILLGLILGIGTGNTITLNKELQAASSLASAKLEELFPGGEMKVDQWNDEREVSITYSPEDCYASYRLLYVEDTDYFNPYEINYYTSFYLRSFTAEDIRTDLEKHLDKLQHLPYPPGTDAGFLFDIPLDDFSADLQEAATTPNGDYSKEYRYDLEYDGYEISVHLNMDVYEADNPDYNSITVSLYTYCWDFEY